MWTMIIITLLAAPAGAGGTIGGVSTAMSYVDFTNPQKCAAAAAAVAQDGSFPNSTGAYYRIITKCVARGPAL